MPADLTQPLAVREHYDFLDGVRAVAVSLVVLFHFELVGLPGGFLGVDMFFVISGFLVSDLILRNLASGNFSLLRFFERRVYRILPALYASLILVLLAGYFLLLPSDLAQTADSARASALLFANINFHSTIEYFNQGSQFWMLLHHWSLSVEEQFYLIFPFVLVALSALKVSLRRIISVLLILAFVYAYTLSLRAPSAAFYLVQARFWEFLVGAQIAVLPRTIKLTRSFAEFISIAAIGIILVGARFIAEPSDLYHLATLVTVAATAGLIWANINTPSTSIGALLSIGWVRKIGLISYSMYILHWPFILFAQYWAIEPLSQLARLGVLVAMVAASWLSWRYVEQPFRTIPAKTLNVRRAGIFAMAATTMLIVLASSWIIANNGFESRQSVRVKAALAGRKAYSPDRTRCHSHEITNSISPEKACILGADTNPTIAVWSDSHGVELAYAIAKSRQVLGKSVLQLTSSGCLPTLGYTPPTIRNCAAKNLRKLEFLVKNTNIKYVVLAMSNEHFMRANPPQLDGTIRALRNAGKMVILIKAVPRAPFNVPHAQARMAYFERPQPLSTVSLVSHQNASAVMNAQSAIIPKGTDFRIIDPADDFCDGSVCYNSVKGEMLYFDDSHPSLYGAHLVAKRVMDVISLAEK
jgi:peptidoglycan/LPS O-acetylase OafA/YrhL